MNPWTELPDAAPYVLPSDVSQVTQFNAKAQPDHTLRVDAMPEPFIGRPNAPVLLLNLNPGFKLETPVRHSQPYFREYHRRNLLHKELPIPFYMLDPLMAGESVWWERKLGRLIEATSREAVAHGILCVEWFPYPSRRFRGGRLRLPSQGYGAQLVQRAIERDALIVPLRSWKLWATMVPDLEDYPSLVQVKNWQNPTISPKNCGEGFDAIVQLLRAA